MIRVASFHMYTVYDGGHLGSRCNNSICERNLSYVDAATNQKRCWPIAYFSSYPAYKVIWRRPSWILPWQLGFQKEPFLHLHTAKYQNMFQVVALTFRD